MKMVRDGPLRPRARSSGPSRQEVAALFRRVARQGDRALCKEVGLSGPLALDRASFGRAFRQLGASTRAALEAACRHHGAVTRRELASLKQYDARPTSGVTVYHRRVPLARVGLLVPARRVSVLVAGAIPAAVAGVDTRVVCTPAGPDGTVDPVMLAAAYMCDVTHLFAVGGLAALAALSRGTESVPAVDRVVGLGGPEIRVARELLGDRCAVDVNRGPRELLILADHTASPEFIAADLLAQAEADPDALCALITVDEKLVPSVQAALRRALRDVPREDAVRGPLRRARARWVTDLSVAVKEANDYAPQRLSLQVQRPDDVTPHLRQYGTLLVGPHTPATLAEYVTGGPDLLPDAGRARYHSASGVADLQRTVDLQQVDPSVYPRLARLAARLAELEGRPHARRALDIRMFPG